MPILLTFVFLTSVSFSAFTFLHRRGVQRDRENGVLVSRRELINAHLLILVLSSVQGGFLTFVLWLLNSIM